MDGWMDGFFSIGTKSMKSLERLSHSYQIIRAFKKLLPYSVLTCFNMVVAQETINFADIL